VKRSVAIALLVVALVSGGCADSGANAPPPKHHLRPTSNQNPDTEAH
jgi:hypothetical protein